jgi:hypothetical protein
LLGFLKGLQIRAQLENRVVVRGGEVFLHLPPPLSTAGIWTVFNDDKIVFPSSLDICFMVLHIFKPSPELILGLIRYFLNGWAKVVFPSLQAKAGFLHYKVGELLT